MWNVVEVISSCKTVLKGYDGRPLRFTEKFYADRMAYELNSAKECEVINYIVVEEKNA